ncbi:MAG: heme exporter protein CcmB [Dehalococcoidia bacterium]|nr:heme exporter protein CcmB [Dehalococcoidia bacterium]
MTSLTAVVAKDLRLAWRNRAAWLSAMAFSTIAVLTYSFAFDLATGDVRPLLPGVLWTTFLFAGVFAAGQSFQEEVDDGTFDALLFSPVGATTIFLGKLTANLIALLIIECSQLVLATILFDVGLLTPELLGIVVIGTVGYVSLTTLLATMGGHVRGRSVLLPVLSLPLLVPLLIGAVRATGASLGLEAGTAPWMLLLLVFAIWSTLAAVLLFPIAAEQ